MEVAVLPVSEIESLVLLPAVASAIASSEGFAGQALDVRLGALRDELVALASTGVEAAVMQYCRRRIDRTLKKVDLSAAKTSDHLAEEYLERTQAVDVRKLAEEARSTLEIALRAKNLPAMLRYFDGKGAFMAAAAKHLKSTRREHFEEWLLRVLRSGSVPGLVDAFRQSLPAIPAPK